MATKLGVDGDAEARLCFTHQQQQGFLPKLALCDDPPRWKWKANKIGLRGQRDKREAFEWGESVLQETI